MKVRSIDDSWRPSNLQNAQQLQKLLSELDDLGIPIPQIYVTHEYWLPLTSNTFTFSKLYVGLLEDCLNLATPEIMNVIDDVIVSVLQAQIQYVLSSLTSQTLQMEVRVKSIPIF